MADAPQPASQNTELLTALLSSISERWSSAMQMAKSSLEFANCRDSRPRLKST
jgi:hypothetical protein